MDEDLLGRGVAAQLGKGLGLHGGVKGAGHLRHHPPVAFAAQQGIDHGHGDGDAAHHIETKHDHGAADGADGVPEGL